MNALIRLPVALLHLAFSVLFFRPAFALLPNRVRWSSAGFISMAALYFAASMVRHGYFSNFPLEGLIVGRLMYLGFLFLVFGGQRLAELTLYLVASAGIDVLASVVAAFGIDIDVDIVRTITLSWEVVAAGVAILRLQIWRKSQSTADAIQETSK